VPRVVIAGLGDTGLLTALHLARHPDLEIVGISSQPGLVSGQELGMRLARPEDWQRDYRRGFEKFKGLDRVTTVHAELVGLDPAQHRVRLRAADGTESDEPYDVLVIATGVRNGFWRTPTLRTDDEVTAGLAGAHHRVAAAASVLVVGGGAAAVSSALQIAQRWPEKVVTLAFPGERALPSYHPRTWKQAQKRLRAAGVHLHSGHRAVVPADFSGAMTTGPVAWQTGQPQTDAEVVVWAIGKVVPNTAWLPARMLDEGGFVRADLTLQTPGYPDIFTIGDVAATDPLRSSARARADALLAANIRAYVAGQPLKEFTPLRRRWGSVLGVEPDGLRVFAPNGRSFRFPRWSVRPLLQRWIVDRGIYRGVRR